MWGHKQIQKTRDKISKNNARFWLGKHRTEKTKIKISIKNKGKLSGNKNPSWKGGKPICLVCKKSLKNYYAKHCFKHSIRRGSKNNKWKGGITPLVQQIRHCFKYRQWRSDVFTRDSYVCVLCLK